MSVETVPVLVSRFVPGLSVRIRLGIVDWGYVKERVESVGIESVNKKLNKFES